MTDTNPAATKFNWARECKVANARTGTSSTQTSNTLNADLDFGQNYQAGDKLTATCSLKQSKITRTTSEIATVAASDTMGSADKTLTLLFTPILVTLTVTPSLTTTNTNPAQITWTKKCTAVITRQTVTLDTITKEVPTTTTSLDFGRVFLKDDSVAVTCDINEKVGTGTASTISQAQVTDTVSFTSTADKTSTLTYNTFVVSTYYLLFRIFCLNYFLTASRRSLAVLLPCICEKIISHISKVPLKQKSRSFTGCLFSLVV